MFKRLITTSSRACTQQSFKPQKESPISGTDALLYISSFFIAGIGLTYAAVPLYRIVCQTTGLGGTVRTSSYFMTPEKMRARRDGEKIRVTFNADTSAAMLWQFQPQQEAVYVHPGETSLIFYKAKNPTNEDVIGISTYNIVPLQAGAYFNKIQCFCFEEQKLRSGEEVDMPVFFFIDPEFYEDPQMDNVKEITLSYTFFNATKGLPYSPGSGMLSDGNANTT